MEYNFNSRQSRYKAALVKWFLLTVWEHFDGITMQVNKDAFKDLPDELLEDLERYTRILQDKAMLYHAELRDEVELFLKGATIPVDKREAGIQQKEMERKWCTHLAFTIATGINDYDSEYVKEAIEKQIRPKDNKIDEV